MMHLFSQRLQNIGHGVSAWKQSFKEHLRVTFEPITSWHRKHPGGLRFLIIIACLWHMTAVGTMSFGNDLEATVQRRIHQVLQTLGYCSWNTTEATKAPQPSLTERGLLWLNLCGEQTGQYDPQGFISYQFRNQFYNYMMWTSQWQRWNLFSPDPLRRVIGYTVERWDLSRWTEIRRYEHNTMQWWRRDYYLKTLRRLDEGNNDEPLQDRFLTLVCREHALPAGTPVRLRREYYVIPHELEMRTIEWWHNWKVPWYQNRERIILCPAS